MSIYCVWVSSVVHPCRRSTSLSMRRSTISTVLRRGSPESGSVYSSVLLVTVSPTRRSDSMTRVRPGLDTTSRRGKSADPGLSRPPWHSPSLLTQHTARHRCTGSCWDWRGQAEVEAEREEKANSRKSSTWNGNNEVLKK